MTFLCVYLDRNKQQPQHSWTIANVLAHFTVSFFSLTYKKNSQLAASSSDFEGCENLTSPAFARVNLLKVSVSDYFLSQFLGQEDKIDFYQFTITKVPLFWYTRLKNKVWVNIKKPETTSKKYVMCFITLTKTIKII